MTSKYVRKKRLFIVCMWHTLLHNATDTFEKFSQIFPLFFTLILLACCGCVFTSFLCIIVYICYNIWKFISQDTILFASSSSSFFSVFYFCFFLFISIPTSIFFNNILFSQHKTLTFWFCSQTRSQSNNTQGKLYIIYIK